MKVTISNQNEKLLSFVIAIAMFMEFIDATALNNCLPQIAHSFKVSPLTLKIIITSYLLMLGIVTPICSYINDRIGVRKSYVMAMLVFLTGSIIAGFSLSVSQLVISGFLTTILNWRFIFYINIPFSILSLIMLKRTMMDDPPKVNNLQLDKFGLFLFGLGAALLLWFASTLSQSHIQLIYELCLLVMIVLLFGTYAWRSCKILNPLFAKELWRNKKLLLSMSACTFVQFAIYMPLFVTPILLQIIFHFNALITGLFLLLNAAGFIVAIKFKTSMNLYQLLVVYMLTLLMFIIACQQYYLILLALFLNGLFTAWLVPEVGSTNYSQLAEKYFSQGTTLLSSVGQLSNAFSIAIAVLLLHIFSGHNSGLTVTSFQKCFMVEALFPLIAMLFYKLLFLKS